MSTSSYKPQKGRGLPWPLDTDAPSVADQAETPSEMEAALDVRQDEIAKSEILSGINRPSYDSLFAVAICGREESRPACDSDHDLLLPDVQRA